ncbi:fibrillin-1-like [Macrobrachium nipponense]|uniref:fibrillin-1-like n=1 Tax=Macrobrachium nipponense TaxID=159736 RepID=UPI0030C8C02B
MCHTKLNVFLAAVALSYLCKAQMISEHEILAELFTNINEKLTGLQGALESIEHAQKYIQQSIESQQAQLSSIEESQLVMGKEVKGLQDFMSSLKLPSCSDDITVLLAKDECMDGTHNCSQNAECTDKIFSFACSCVTGYSGDGFECSDIDECTDADICGDHASCKNVEGSYKCECSNGYEMRSNRCQDIDECKSEELHKCQVPATCVNSEGSYECQCLPPYKGDPLNCEMECLQPSVYIGSLGCVTPKFIRLPWEAARRVCEESGGRLLENIENSHFEVLSQHFQHLMSDRPFPWIGFKNKTWVSSRRAVSKKVVAKAEDGLEGDCGNVDLRKPQWGVWDANCFDEEYALCHKV